MIKPLIELLNDSRTITSGNLITKTQAAKLIGVSFSTIDRWIKAKYLPLIKDLDGGYKKQMVSVKGLHKAAELAEVNKQLKPLANKVIKASPYLTKVELDQAMLKVSTDLEAYDKNNQKLFDRINNIEWKIGQDISSISANIHDHNITINRLKHHINDLTGQLAQLKAELTALKPALSSETQEPDHNKSALQEWT